MGASPDNVTSLRRMVRILAPGEEYQAMRKPLLAAVLALAVAPVVQAQPGANIPGPCEDFEAYVNSAWAAATPLPADRARIGSFDDLQQRNRTLLLAALREAGDHAALLDTPGKQKAHAFFLSGLDTAAIERRGVTALQPLLAAIAGLQQRGELPRLMAELNRVGIAAPVSASVAADARDKRRHSVSVGPGWGGGPLGLPDRDDYFRTDERAVAVRAAYAAYTERLLKLSGVPAAAAAEQASQILALEKRLAGAMLPRSELRDPNRLYNPMTVQALARSAPGLDWRLWLDTVGLAAAQDIVVSQPAYTVAVAQAAAELPLAQWQAYLRTRLLDAAAPFLPRAFEQAHFDFRQGALRGLQAPPPRDQHVLDLLVGPFGGAPLAEGIGQIFVAKAFSPVAKERATAMVEDIRAAMAARIERLDWMTAATKARAQVKLAQMRLQIGYPDRWRAYDGLQVSADDFAGNWLRAGRWQVAEHFARLGRPVDRTEWQTTPYIVNAFAGGFNNIVFPAGILQPPFFDASADEATNFGGIGTVIGHEISHHFDDRGRRFDEFGNLNDWWTPQDAKAYQERADRLARQFSAFEPLPGHSINGVATLGENISDLAGIKAAFDGLQIALGRGKAVADTTPQSRGFFVSYATIWRSKMRAEALITQLRSGQHSPGRYRVLGPLGNMPQFAAVFACPPDSPMVRPLPERVAIW
jgi:putative endopeptidase